MMATQTDTKANIGVITLGCQKITVTPLSARRRGGRRLFRRTRTEP